MYISAASGLPGVYDHPNAPIEYFNTATAMGFEAISLINTRAFQVRLDTLGIPATYSFPANGTHSWSYWSAELWQARGQILNTLGRLVTALVPVGATYYGRTRR